MRDEIRQTANKIKDVKDPLPVLQETQHLVRRSLHDRVTCGICQEQVPGVRDGCTACFR
jgi:hypothetical protein